ncbi:hypothetical protein [Microvirga puerhi]|uniref:Uncharacterized protein n=1 Tax=Microvirga puerhi TaxID=2876078 RepID=A0ABS7VQR2_9HYPH|nr:hypothetical protein [Microvirga puerhi]MBZ6077455.1 hypothetical protein [Microvirga puerhi]
MLTANNSGAKPYSLPRIVTEATADASAGSTIAKSKVRDIGVLSNFFSKKDPLFSQEIKTTDSSRCYVEVRKVSMCGTRLVLSQYFGLPTLRVGFTADQAEALIGNLRDAINVARSATIAQQPTSFIAIIFHRLIPKVLFRTTIPTEFPTAVLTMQVEQKPGVTTNKITLGCGVGDEGSRIYFEAEDAEILATVLIEAVRRLREYLNGG